MHGGSLGRFHIIAVLLSQPSVIAGGSRNHAVFKWKIDHFLKPLAVPCIFFQLADKDRIADAAGIFPVKTAAKPFIHCKRTLHGDVKQISQLVQQPSKYSRIVIVIKTIPGIQDRPQGLDGIRPKPGGKFSLRHGVQRENINKDTAVISGLSVLLAASGGLAVANLRMGAQIILLCIEGLQRQRLSQLPWGNADKCLVILPQHHQVNVIIPGDIALMADCTDQGAAVGKVF